MAEKFPSLPDVKQRVFSIDLARVRGAGDERAVVVTGERNRITLFWSRADGSWGSLGREHDALNLSPRRSENAADSGWTPRIGLGAGGSQVALVYKRRFAGSSPRDLWVDLFDFDAATDEFRGGAAPRRFPRQALGIDRFGWCIWADATNGLLHVVAQIFRAGSPNLPRLVLLQHAFPVSDPASLEDPSSWTLVDLDAGGWDFGARRQGDRLVVLHRRDAPTYSTELILPLDPGFGPNARTIQVRLSEDPALVSRTLSDMAVSNLVLVEADLVSNTVTSIDASLPFGENSQIHSVDPFIASVDRLFDAQVSIHRGRALRLRHFDSHCHLLMRTSEGWRTAPLFTQIMRWPHYLGSFARMQQGIALEPAPDAPRLRLSWGSLWTERPIVLFKREEADKGTLFTFGHQDSEIGALRATTFVVFEDDGGNTLKARPEGFVLLDIGHRHITEPTDGPRPIEYVQLEPLEVRSRGEHADGLGLLRIERSANTMTGVLVAHDDGPAAFYAYTEMGDGGARVIFEGQLELPPPTATVDEKTFRIDWVGEPVKLGRAWVRLQTPVVDTTIGPVGATTPTQLPGYFNPISLINPGSLVFREQRSLDGLAFAADRLHGTVSTPVPFSNSVSFELVPGGVVHYREEPVSFSPEDVELIGLGRDTADRFQDFVLAPGLPAPPPRPTRSVGQPFEILIQPLQNAPFANETLAFDGVVVGQTNTTGFQFDWTFSDGTTDAGDQVEHTFQRTLPDFSRTAPGGRRDDIRITLKVTAPDGQISTATTEFALPDSLWATLWTAYGAFRRAPDNILDDDGDWRITEEEWQTFLVPGMFVEDVSLSFYRYRIRYMTSPAGRGTRVEVSNKPVHDTSFRFQGNDAGQGDVVYRLPVRADMDNVRLTGDFGGGIANLVEIDKVEVNFSFTQRFTVGVQTSEQRERPADSETILEREFFLFPPSLDEEMIPSALCCLPVDQLEAHVESVRVRSSLTAAGWSLAILLPAVIVLVGIAALLFIFAILVPALIPALVGGAINAVVAALTAGALGAIVAAAINWLILNGFFEDRIREQLEKPETVTSFRRAGLFTYAGEGLAEALTRQLIRQAQVDGHAVADPGDKGRDRYRSPFFETIVVGENECKVELRV